jgi:hypothetical protein
VEVQEFWTIREFPLGLIRTGELQAWFLAEHLVDTPLVRA